MHTTRRAVGLVRMVWAVKGPITSPSNMNAFARLTLEWSRITLMAAKSTVVFIWPIQTVLGTITLPLEWDALAILTSKLIGWTSDSSWKRKEGRKSIFPTKSMAVTFKNRTRIVSPEKRKWKEINVRYSRQSTSSLPSPQSSSPSQTYRFERHFSPFLQVNSPPQSTSPDGSVTDKTGAEMCQNCYRYQHVRDNTNGMEEFSSESREGSVTPSEPHLILFFRFHRSKTILALNSMTKIRHPFQSINEWMSDWMGINKNSSLIL